MCHAQDIVLESFNLNKLQVHNLMLKLNVSTSLNFLHISIFQKKKQQNKQKQKTLQCFINEPIRAVPWEIVFVMVLVSSI